MNSTNNINNEPIDRGYDMYGRKKPDLLPARDCAITAAKAADSKKATDILVLEVGDLVGLTEYFVIATAANRLQARAVCDEVEKQCLEKAGAKVKHCEGTGDNSWNLLDYGSFIVHVFSPEAREFYKLEDVWKNAPSIDLQKEAGIESSE